MKAAGKRVLQYVFIEKNPIVQIIYILVMTAGYYALHHEMQDFIPNRFIGNYHMSARSHKFT
ncbi:unnamed protein product [Albugo candida]|uniref:Uncharacterized protein n=1 Tax=Albugo candida TaxID=65357 RepID=A0A024FY66_9STRA|nr:unnamed protein product [Albugo candida]|eukprot:CCI39431.1 unnamed protein product [Albugo candida]